MRDTLPSVFLLAAALSVITLSCGGERDATPSADSTAVALAAPAIQLPITPQRARLLATEAERRLDPANAVLSGGRSCDVAQPQQESTECQLSLTPRTDSEDFGPDRVPGGYVVIATVTNIGSRPESRTGIPAGVKAYLLVEQGQADSANAWYFSVDHGNQGAIAVHHQLTFLRCQHQHPGAKPRAAWRRCTEGTPSIMEKSTAGAHRHDLPPWVPCVSGCCLAS